EAELALPDTHVRREGGTYHCLTADRRRSGALRCVDVDRMILRIAEQVGLVALVRVAIEPNLVWVPRRGDGDRRGVPLEGVVLDGHAGVGRTEEVGDGDSRGGIRHHVGSERRRVDGATEEYGRLTGT